MANSSFYDVVVKGGFGLTEFIKKQFPDRPDMLEIKPVMEDGPHKGFFPAGKVAAIFGGRFNHWHDSLKKTQKGKKFVQRVLERLAGLGK